MGVNRVRSMRESIQASKSLGVPRQEDSSLGTIENLLKRNIATPDEIIKALGSQKVRTVRAVKDRRGSVQPNRVDLSNRGLSLMWSVLLWGGEAGTERGGGLMSG